MGAAGRADLAAAEAEAVAWCERLARTRPSCRVVSFAGPLREEERGISLAAWEPDERLVRVLPRPAARTAGAEVKMSSECDLPGAFFAGPKTSRDFA